MINLLEHTLHCLDYFSDQSGTCEPMSRQAGWPLWVSHAAGMCAAVEADNPTESSLL
jgi:hypothetical protein